MTATHASPRSSRSVSQTLLQNDRRPTDRSRSRRSASSRHSRRTLQSVAPLPSPISPSIVAPQHRSLHGHRRRTRRFYYLSLISEASLKIVINALLLSAFAVALGRLLPEMWRNHQQRLAIETELELTQQRVQILEQNFSKTFDPSSSIDLIEQQSYQVDPHKQRIVFLEKSNPE